MNSSIISPLMSLLYQYKPHDEIEAAYSNQLQQFISDSNNPYDRSNLIAHVVADAWVVSPDRTQVLLLVHGESKAWNTPGGHPDGNPDIWASAMRELEEETGLTSEFATPLLNGQIFDINVGMVPNRMKSNGFEPIHLHFDICFAFEADPDLAPLKISDESLDIGWKPVEEALKVMMEGHRRRAEKTLAGFLS